MKRLLSSIVIMILFIGVVITLATSVWGISHRGVRQSASAQPGFTVTPADGSTVEDGSTVTVQVFPNPGTTVTAATIISSIGNLEVLSAPFQLPLQIPANFTGPLKLLVMAQTEAGNLSDEPTLNVVPPSSATLENISISPAELIIARFVQGGYSIGVNGDFSDGVTRVLTRSPDTIYAVDDPSVAVVKVTDTGAIVQPKKVGKVTITISNQGIRAVLPVNVAGTIDGDVNQDCAVDYRDLQIARQALGARVRDPKYNGLADINSDGVIDTSDVQFIRSRLGTRCP